MTEWSPLFSEPHPSREFCVQYGETDYDFLCRMAAEEGIFFYEEHAQKSTDQSLVLCDTVRYLPESFEIPWNPNTRTEVSTLCISQFRYSAQIRPSSVVTKDYTFKRPGWPGRFDQEGQYQDYQRTQYEVYDYPGRFKGAHGQNFARWQMDGWRNNAEVARGTSRSPEIWPGRRIVLTGHPQANLNREWQVVASDLHGEQPQAVPGRRGSGTTLENHFAVIPADRTWRPQPLMKPLVDGPQSAVVTGPAGEEIFCDEHGRVRVKFNWDRYNPSNQDSSCWIRVAQAWAGTGFGNLAIPRVGQEVIVDFLNGDPDQPIIMGRTYHQENRTPGSLPGTKTQMTIRSKTYKGSGFNELKFDDATGKEQVYIHAQKNMNTEVLNNRTTDVINNHAETIGNNQMIAVTNNQIETVGVNQIETVGSNQIIKVGSVQVETIGLVRALTVGVAYQTTVGGIMNTSVALMQSSQIGLHKSLRVGLGYDVKVGNNVTFTVGKTKKDDTGQTAIYSAGEHLELCCGKARLVLTKDGQIFLNGTKIHLQGKEQVNGDSLLINWNCAASKSPQNFRIFQNEDIESILATILKENGVTEWSPLFSEPHPSREFCVQYGETDYDFLCRMAAEEGIFFYEEHAQKSTDQSLVLCDTVRYLPESFEIPWNPNTRTEVSTFCISQFRYSAQIRPSSVVTKDYTFKRPGWAGRFDQEGQYQDYQRTQYEVYDYPGRFKGAHGQNFARWQMDGWRNNAEVARGTSRSPEIWPGRRIVLTGHPQANLNREWQVVASELHGEQPQAVPGRSGSGTTLNNHFAVIPADRTWRPQPLLKPLVDGPQSAVVTGPAGEEIFCDEHGRVRVKFNWDRYNPSNQDSSCWIRVAQAWAGTGFGNLAIPRVGQEVIVDFLNGDPDQPIIMGRTYHQENRTPGSLPGTKTQMTIRSKTYKGSGFNELKFDDATGKEQVYIHVQKNMNTEVLNNRTTDVINNHAEKIGNNQAITVTNNQMQNGI
ncbi:Rhs element protein [Shigella sonnei]|nr:Rhs element protein [Shigella sonnei]